MRGFFINTHIKNTLKVFMGMKLNIVETTV